MKGFIKVKFIVLFLMTSIFTLFCYAAEDGDSLTYFSKITNPAPGEKIENSALNQKTNINSKTDNILSILKNSETEFRVFNEIGFKVGFTLNEYGWYHPDPFIANAYNHPDISTISVSAYGDFFKFKSFSTLLDAGFLLRGSKFEYDAVDNYGNVIGVKTASNTVYLMSLSLSEKLQYNIKSWEFYAYAGGRGNFTIGKSIEPNFQNVFNNSKTSVFGLTTGIGAGLHPGKKGIIYIELYYNPDFTRTYSSEFGYNKNEEYGIKLGVGFNFKKGEK
jgi:hypothetical protein